MVVAILLAFWGLQFFLLGGVQARGHRLLAPRAPGLLHAPVVIKLIGMLCGVAGLRTLIGYALTIASATWFSLVAARWMESRPLGALAFGAPRDRSVIRRVQGIKMQQRQDSNYTAPVFLVGTGRCGSTIVDSVLSMHPAFSWMPSWVDSFRVPELAAVNRLWAIPGTDEYRVKRFFPTPVEPYETFKRYDPTFMTEKPSEEAIASARATIIPLIRRICRAHGNPRYLAKLVGRPVKVWLFSRLFPDAYFVHVTRELKPTLSSLLKVDFYTDWGSDLRSWPWGEIPSAYLDFWERCDGANEIGAAIGLYLNRREVDSQLAQVDRKRVVEVAYADFVRDPMEATRLIANQVYLDFPDDFAARVRARAIYGDADQKWKDHLSGETIKRLNEFEALTQADSSQNTAE